MNNVSPIASSALTITATQLVPTVNWVLSGCKGTAPADLSALIAGAVVLLLHVGYNWLVARSAAKSAPAAQ